MLRNAGLLSVLLALSHAAINPLADQDKEGLGLRSFFIPQQTQNDVDYAELLRRINAQQPFEITSHFGPRTIIIETVPAEQFGPAPDQSPVYVVDSGTNYEDETDIRPQPPQSRPQQLNPDRLHRVDGSAEGSPDTVDIEWPQPVPSEKAEPLAKVPEAEVNGTESDLKPFEEEVKPTPEEQSAETTLASIVQPVPEATEAPAASEIAESTPQPSDPIKDFATFALLAIAEEARQNATAEAAEQQHPEAVAENTSAFNVTSDNEDPSTDLSKMIPLEVEEAGEAVADAVQTTEAPKEPEPKQAESKNEEQNDPELVIHEDPMPTPIEADRFPRVTRLRL